MAIYHTFKKVKQNNKLLILVLCNEADKQNSYLVFQFAFVCGVGFTFRA